MSTVLQTLARGVQVMKLLAASDVALAVGDVGDRLGIERTAAYRILVTLESEHLAERDADGRWRIDMRATRLAPIGLTVLASEATPILRELAASVGRTSSLTVAQGSTAMALRVCEPAGPGFHISYREGTTHPVEAGAAGLAILAGEAPIAGERAEIDAARSSGFAESVGELQAHAHGCAVVLAGSRHRASVGVISLEPIEPSDVLPSLRRAAEQLAALDG